MSFTDLLKHEAGKILTIKDTEINQQLPPSSLQRFLKLSPIPGFVITDHEIQYSNK